MCAAAHGRVYEWQTLIAGLLALLAGGGTVWGTLRAANCQVKTANAAADREIKAANEAADRQIAAAQEVPGQGNGKCGQTGLNRNIAGQLKVRVMTSRSKRTTSVGGDGVADQVDAR
jgi:hypothetical protein